MNYCLAVFSSITYANRLKNILNNKIGYIALMHAPSGITDSGCAYCLRFRRSSLETVKNAAAENGIKIKGLFEEENGSYGRLEI